MDNFVLINSLLNCGLTHYFMVVGNFFGYQRKVGLVCGFWFFFLVQHFPLAKVMNTSFIKVCVVLRIPFWFIYSLATPLCWRQADVT